MRCIQKISYKTTYQCRDCGATSYQPVISRAENGALLPTGRYRCTGCRSIFDTVRDWRLPRNPADGMRPLPIRAAMTSCG